MKNGNNDNLNCSAAAAILGVSHATVRNWVKTGVLKNGGVEKLALCRGDVLSLAASIAAGEVARLTKRANKSGRDGNEKQIEHFIFSAALSDLAQAGEWSGARLSADEFRRKCVWVFVDAWYRRIGGEVSIELTEGDAVELYQRLSNSGSKARKGAFYTPEYLALSAFENIPTNEVQRFLDPCCGAGIYLTSAARTFPTLPPEAFFGVDIDPVACNLARLRMFLHFRNDEFTPKIFCADALKNFPILGEFDLICSNPPWGAAKNSGCEIFSKFIEASLGILSAGGTLSFLLPESILNVKRHAGIRDFIEKKFTVYGIKHLGACFSGVYTKVIRLTILNQVAECDNHVAHSLSRAERELLAQIFATPHVTLKGHADWGIGIVSGNNRKFLLSSGTAETTPVLRGADIGKFLIKKPCRHLLPGQHQQTAPARIYGAKEKLIYKFVSAIPVFACDCEQQLTLNSANIVIPNLDKYSLPTVAALLNSSVIEFVFRKMMHSNKLLKCHIEAFPLALLSDEQHAEIERMAKLAIAQQQPSRELDEYICRIYGVSSDLMNSFNSRQ